MCAIYLLYTSELDTKVREIANKTRMTLRINCNNLLLVLILTEYWVHYKGYIDLITQNHFKSLKISTPCTCIYMYIKNLQSIVKTNPRGVPGTQ